MLSFHEEQEVLPETFLANFPSLIKIDIHKKVTDPSVAKSMMACLLSSLKANGEFFALGIVEGCSGYCDLRMTTALQPVGASQTGSSGGGANAFCIHMLVCEI